MSFSEKMNQINQAIIKNLNEDKGDVAIKLLNGMLSIAESQYSKEFQALLIKSGVKKDLALWNEFAVKFLNEVDSLEIDPWKNIVELELNGEKLEAPLFIINDYIYTLKNLNAYEKLLIATYLGTPVNSKIVQVYHCFLKD